MISRKRGTFSMVSSRISRKRASVRSAKLRRRTAVRAAPLHRPGENRCRSAGLPCQNYAGSSMTLRARARSGLPEALGNGGASRERAVMTPIRAQSRKPMRVPEVRYSQV
jgi:hypothetical protein